jgi:hypothetical protein
MLVPSPPFVKVPLFAMKPPASMVRSVKLENWSTLMNSPPALIVRLAMETAFAL